MGQTLVKKPRNNFIEFLRFTFAINFVLIHVMQVFPLAYLGFTASAALNQYIFCQLAGHYHALHHLRRVLPHGRLQAQAGPG